MVRTLTLDFLKSGAASGMVLGLAARRRKILAQTRTDTHTAQANIDPA